MAIMKVKDGGVAKELSIVSNVDVNELKALVAELASHIIGKIDWFGTREVPDKWLLCDGRELAIVDYEDLYNAIGTQFGSASSPYNFKLPDLINRVAWGGTTAGAYKDAGLPNITGRAGMNYIVSDGHTPFADYEGAFYRSDESVGSAVRKWPGVGATGDNRHFPHFRFNASRSSSIYGKSTTVQPPALTLLPCIRAVI